MNSTEQTLEQALERSAPKVLEIHEAIRIEGEHELSRPPMALALSGLAAGLSMGFSLLTEALLTHHLPQAEWVPLVAKFGYCVGFLIVILGRQQLFTENTLTPILALFSEPEPPMFMRLFRLWAVVLVANLVGAALFAACIACTNLLEHPVHEVMLKIGQSALEPEAMTIFLRAIFAGWLIALMVWLLPFAETARIWVIILVTYVVGLGHFAHIIAGSVDVFYLVFSSAAGLGQVVNHYMLPTLLGNTLGGVSLVAILHHAQLRADHGEEGPPQNESPQSS